MTVYGTAPLAGVAPQLVAAIPKAGTTVTRSRTARIEPVTPPGEVYVTEQFAARLALEPNAYACDYVGQIPAAKSYGTMRMYHLHAPRNY